MILREMLTQTSKGWRTLNAPLGAWVVEEFLVRNGVDGQAQELPDDYGKGLAQRCFANTVGIVRRNTNLRFVEGYACRMQFPVPFLHAWAIDQKNRVIDVTLNRPEECEYVGYPMLLAKRKLWLAKDSLSVFDTGRGMNYKFFLHEDRTMLDLISSETRQRFMLDGQ